jgi:hypothetical protein
MVSSPGRWWFYPDLRPADIQSYLASYNATPVSLQPANIGPGTFNVIMNQNPDSGIGPTSWWCDVDDEQIQSLVNPETMHVIDIKSYYIGQVRCLLDKRVGDVVTLWLMTAAVRAA